MSELNNDVLDGLGLDLPPLPKIKSIDDVIGTADTPVAATPSAPVEPVVYESADDAIAAALASLNSTPVKAPEPPKEPVVYDSAEDAVAAALAAANNFAKPASEIEINSTPESAEEPTAADAINTDIDLDDGTPAEPTQPAVINDIDITDDAEPAAVTDTADNALNAEITDEPISAPVTPAAVVNTPKAADADILDDDGDIDFDLPQIKKPAPVNTAAAEVPAPQTSHAAQPASTPKAAEIDISRPIPKNTEFDMDTDVDFDFDLPPMKEKPAEKKEPEPVQEKEPEPKAEPEEDDGFIYEYEDDEPSANEGKNKYGQDETPAYDDSIIAVEDDDYNYEGSLDDIDISNIRLDDMDKKTMPRGTNQDAARMLLNRVLMDDMQNDIESDAVLDDLSNEYQTMRDKIKNDNFADKDKLNSNEKQALKNKLSEEINSRPQGFNQRMSMSMANSLAEERNIENAKKGFLITLVVMFIGFASAVVTYIGTHMGAEPLVVRSEIYGDYKSMILLLCGGTALFSFMLMIKNKHIKMLTTIFYGLETIALLGAGLGYYLIKEFPNLTDWSGRYLQIVWFLAAAILSGIAVFMLSTNEYITDYYITDSNGKKRR